MSTRLLNGATATGPSATVTIRSSTTPYVFHSFQAVGVMSVGTGTASVTIEVSDDGTNFMGLGVITLALTTSASSDGFAVTNTWNYIRANLTQVTTNGSVSVHINP